MTTVNDWGSDHPAEATKGGTGQSTYTTGDIIYSSASNTWSKLAVGANTEVLTLASGIPSWAAAGGASAGWTWLNTQTASNSSSINFDSTYVTSTYDVYMIVSYNVQPISDADIILRFSPDNGSTVRSSGYDADSMECSSSTNTNATDGIDIQKGTIGGATDEGHGVSWIFVANASDSGLKTVANAFIGFVDRFGDPDIGFGFGKYDTAETHNYIRFVASTGNIDTGTFTLYGLNSP